MFESLRKNASWIIIVLAAVFILSMAIGGITSLFVKKPFAAEIAGEKISPKDYQQYLETTFANYAQQNDSKQIDEKTRAQLKQQTWNQLIDEIIITKAVKQNRIKVTDKEIFEKLKNPDDQIKSIPQFQIDGNFDQDTYLGYLQQDERFAAVLENEIRSTLPLEKLYDKIKNEVSITEEDVRQNYIDSNNKAKAKIIYFDSNKIKNIEITDDELAKHYEETKEDYKKGPARKLRYIKLNLTPSEADKKNSEVKANEIFQEVTAGANFAEIAKAKSDGPSAPKGGDLGFFTKNKMVKPFADAAFAMKVGEISQPVQTRFGWHIIKVNAIQTNEAGEKEVKASHILIEEKTSEETKLAFTQRAEDLLTTAKNDGVEKAAEVFNEEAKETTEFYEDASYISGL
ncbi:MAG: SurA N-terminal domain-containing protein, partial [Candidatus Cloacimonetes bacterium]|nr:SurA N-terminal domain-containing protein [Candidatus Cloacimonadota bacterium]